ARAFGLRELHPRLIHAARLARRTRRGRSLGAELAQEHQPLVAHLGQVAGDAAVVADELFRGCLVLFDVRRVEQLAERLAARRRQAPLERLAILLGQKVRLETDVDDVPRQPRTCRDRSQIELDWRAGLGERALPPLEIEMLVPAVEAGAALPG